VVWGHSKRLETRALDIAILRLRKKVESTPRRPSHILSEYGEGYSFVPLEALQGGDRPQRAGPPPALKALSTNIGPRPNTFWGRADALGRLSALYASKKGFISVLGPPGIGKTRLVRHWARQLREDQRAQSLFFCDLSRCESVDDIHRTLVGTLDLATTDSLDDETQRLRRLGRAIAERKIDLLILDNVEQALLATQTVLATLMDYTRDTTLVITSQVALRTPAEQQVHVAPLDTRADGSTTAVDLFRARAAQVQAKLPEDAETDAQIRALVESLDGVPLAIELAAGRTRMMSITAIHARLQAEQRRPGRTHRGDGSDRHASMWRTIQWAWDMLDPTERSVLAQCSVFAGSFTWEAAEAILTVPEDETRWQVDVVADLTDRSLILVSQLGDRAGRLSLLSSIRGFAASKLLELPELKAATEQRLSDYFIEQSLQSRAAWQSCEKGRYGPYGDLENLLVAVDWVIEQRDLERVRVGGMSALIIQEGQGIHHQSIAIIDRMLALPHPPTALNHLRQYRGWHLFCCGKMTEAAAQWQQTLRWYRAHLDPQDPPPTPIRGALDWLSRPISSDAIVRNLNGLGGALRILGRVTEAEACYREAIEILEHPGVPSPQLLVTYLNLGKYFLMTGQDAAALDALERIEALFEGETPDARMAADVHLFRGLVHIQTHDLEAGQRSLEQAVRIGREIRFDPLVVLALGGLAKLAAKRGAFSVAEDLLGEARSHAVLAQRPMLRMGLDAAIGVVCRLRGDTVGMEAAATRLRALAIQFEAENSPEYRAARAEVRGSDDTPREPDAG